MMSFHQSLHVIFTSLYNQNQTAPNKNRWNISTYTQDMQYFLE
nr:MAG TPA: hypothetical protein [Caudoviricetes sp.]